MQTRLADFLRDTPEGRDAESVLRACVHCGFCNATCPTYQVLGDELDGPRGRIYLMKQMVEGEPVTAETRLHLDRCLTCRACETTCPSGVEYGKLVEVGRTIVEQRAPRPPLEQLFRRVFAWALLQRWLFGFGLAIGRVVRPLLPAVLRQKIPKAPPRGAWPPARHARRWVLLEGCVQPAMFPDLNAATARVLDAIGLSTVTAPAARCCGALRLHLGQTAAAMDDVRRSIDAWWPLVEQGVEGFVMNASGCGVTVREWGHLLREDPRYRDRAARIASMTRDVGEVVAAELATLVPKLRRPLPARIAFHPPCTLQHGQQLRGQPENVLRAAGADVRLPVDSHLCCGSAGTYSILQPALGGELRARKLRALDDVDAQVVASANVGCLAHLQRDGGTPVRHWIELIDEALR